MDEHDVTMVVPTDMAEWLEATAKAKGMTVSELVTEAIRLYVERHHITVDG
jgi:hypothetical protein